MTAEMVSPVLSSFARFVSRKARAYAVWQSRVMQGNFVGVQAGPRADRVRCRSAVSEYDYLGHLRPDCPPTPRVSALLLP
jgi:hypothetical protein